MPERRSPVESSIVIPVYNQWKLTKSCLLGLHQTLSGKNCEVLVIDNASSDLTASECPVLGRQLFGDRFIYHRADRNMNFGPASNLGAKLGSGEFVIFLNNDTVPLPGWYDPLIEDFTTYPGIAATGPLLLYPKTQPFGFTIQHLGVYVTPFRSVGHLHEGISADSPLAQKRRFFQVITAACMVMRRHLFLDAGMFDEEFINGFEDVDLCLRLYSQGYKMTVNPKSRVIHITSQTAGRYKAEQHNAIHLHKKTNHLLKADWIQLCQEDGLDFSFGLDLRIEMESPRELTHRLDAYAEHLSYEELRALLVRDPFWKKGCLCLLDKMKSQGLSTDDFSMTTAKNWFCPQLLRRMYEEACSTQDKVKGTFVLDQFMDICEPFSYFTEVAEMGVKNFGEAGLGGFQQECRHWLDNKDTIYATQYLPALKTIREMDEAEPFESRPLWAQPPWLELRRKLTALGNSSVAGIAAQ